MSVIKRQQRPFTDRVKIGEYGEDATIQFFKSKNYKYIDVRKIPEYQKDEIDFIVEINGKEYTVEVKASENNIYKYNSIMVKLLTAYEDTGEAIKRGNDAYLFRTKADYLFYVCCVSGDIIITKTKKIKDYVNANKHNLLIKTYYDSERNVLKSKYNRVNTVAYIPISKLDSKSLKRVKTNYKFNPNLYNISTKRQ